MTSSNSRSLIVFLDCFPQLSSKFEIMADASMAVAPVAPIEPELTGPEAEQLHPRAETPEPVFAGDVGLQVLEAELGSLKKAMLEVTAVEEADVPTHDVPVDDVEDVAKAQLKLLLGIQGVVKLQYKTQQNALKSQMISARVVETCSQFHIKAVEKEVQVLASHIATDVGLGQSSLDKIESTLDKFGASFNTLGDTLNRGTKKKRSGNPWFEK